MDEERLIVALEARIRDFEKNMAKAERTGAQSYTRLRHGSRSATTAMEADMIRSTNRINQALAATSTRIGTFAKAFAVGAAATGIAAFTRGATAAVKSMAEIERQAQRAGLSVEAFQELKFVSEQSKIDVDAMVDGLKELQLRADEFIVTGKGSGAEAFARLGYAASDLKRRLEEPEELFLDIIDRMEDLDRAAQIRVADEIFGGTGGERFVELLSQGDDGIRDMMDRAHELGLVIEAETISKAAELDRRFAEVQARIGAMAKGVVVELADAIDDAFTVDIEERLGGAERAIAILGEEIYSALKGAPAVLEETEAKVIDLNQVYADLFAAINNATGPDGIRLMDVADIDTAHELAAILADIDAAMVAFENGKMSAEEFEAGVVDLVTEADTLLGSLSDVDAARFGNVIAAIGGISGALAAAIANARALRAELPGGDAATQSGVYGEVGARGDPRLFMEGRDGDALAPEVSPRPQLPSVNASFGVPDAPSGSGRASGGGRGGGGRGGGGRGGGAARLDDFRREMERTREEVARLEAEAVALAAVAETGFEYGDAVEYARKRAELLYEAQAAGKEITPELKAEIDNLAAAYVQAGAAADEAADRLEEMQENAERGVDIMTDLFLSIMDGSASAEDALRRLIAEFARLQIQKGLMGLADAGGGGFFGFLGSLFSGRATGGPVSAGMPYLVNERTPNSEVFVPSQSGGVLNVPQAQAALRQAAGGNSSEPTKIEIVGSRLSLTDDGRIMAEVNARIGRGITSTVSQMERTLPEMISQYNADPRVRR